MSRKKESRYLVGFAVETENEQKNAGDKLKRKKLDLIVMNNPMAQGSGFATDTNRVTIIDKKNNLEKLPLLSKQEVAEKIFDKIESDISPGI
jgi:phosphopantothenoylcysteine decarboxylase/phosphopantothenate--cysteine ligase